MKKIAILVLLVIASGLAITKMFGQTVSSKFQHANSSVQSNVTFGGSGGGPAYRTERAQTATSRFEARRAQPAPADEVAFNPAVDAAIDSHSTFALDVDTASYTYARAALKNGGTPVPSSIRPEEFVNYFQYDREPPVADTPFAVTMESSPSPISADRRTQYLRVKVDSKVVDDADRKPAHLTFLIDVSGSMIAPNKLPLAKESLKYLVSQLDERDTIAIATYAGSSRLVLPPTSAANDRAINGALAGLEAGGGTAMSAGMDLAYEAAIRAHEPGHSNRVIVVSDGDANIGSTNHEEILATIRSRVDDGIQMSTVGVGMGNYRSELMEQLANNGDGNAFYVDEIREAKRIFGQGLVGTLEVVAKEAKVQVEFDPELVETYRLIGYENRDIADEDFRNDSVDAGEIGAGHQVTAVYEVKMRDHRRVPYVRAFLRWMDPEAHVAREGVRDMRPTDFAASVGASSRDHQFAIGTVLFAQKLRRAPDLDDVSWQLIEEVARPGAVAEHPERFELLELIRMAAGRS